MLRGEFCVEYSSSCSPFLVHPNICLHHIRAKVSPTSHLLTITHENRGIGLETAILFAKEGANVLLADISEPALEKAVAKVKELVPAATRLETRVCLFSFFIHHMNPRLICIYRNATSPRRLTSRP